MAVPGNKANRLLLASCSIYPMKNFHFSGVRMTPPPPGIDLCDRQNEGRISKGALCQLNLSIIVRKPQLPKKPCPQASASAHCGIWSQRCQGVWEERCVILQGSDSIRKWENGYQVNIGNCDRLPAEWIHGDYPAILNCHRQERSRRFSMAIATTRWKMTVKPGFGGA